MQEMQLMEAHTHELPEFLHFLEELIEEPWASKFSDSNFVNYKTNNLSEFLKKINLLRAA